MLDNFKG